MHKTTPCGQTKGGNYASGCCNHFVGRNPRWDSNLVFLLCVEGYNARKSAVMFAEILYPILAVCGFVAACAALEAVLEWLEERLISAPLPPRAVSVSRSPWSP